MERLKVFLSTLGEGEILIVTCVSVTKCRMDLWMIPCFGTFEETARKCVQGCDTTAYKSVT